jgi:hypothetical protein
VVQADISQEKDLHKLRADAPPVIHHLILASLGKHIGGSKTLETILKIFDNAKNIYFETNAVGDEFIDEERVIGRHGGLLVNMSTDRNRRRLWRISRL